MLRRKPGPRRLRIMGQRHAKRLPKGLKPIRPGELVQIDTLFVNVAPDKAVKHFTAYDPVAKWTVALVAGRATARCAAALLDKLIAEVPFRIEGIQVDGGSEFRAEFEEACRERNLCLFVLPPKRPQLNGHVERAQGSWRYEFYGVEDLPSRLKPLQLRIDAFAHRFNHTRPHRPPGPKMVVCISPELGLFFRINTEPNWQTSIKLFRGPNHLFLEHDSHLECGEPLDLDEYVVEESIYRERGI